ncbi:hypothetical protein N8J89_01550 [Crossiella sp. CA-258035]|uniref:hypothetical protein n=1 Tax=Crossiella sp. CA-258035 TaxID=2981138 RepID=UPI0024BCCBC6|nr:hypothetical protein [Crossiella sp. CA-258035]WHT19793.1 hypothetical protein N8J89_01550 [Crossiella sp. CA-258035]
MGQLSFYSAEARQPRVADLAGLLCGPGQAVGFGRGAAAKVTVELAESWRAHAVVLACAERGVQAEAGVTEDGRRQLRTAFRRDLAPLATAWLRGAEKTVPEDLELDGPALRIWALTAGQPETSGYSLGLDPLAPHTYPQLTAALLRLGLAGSLLGAKAGGPALRFTGRRRLARLAELVGPTPVAAEHSYWPAA